MTNVFIAGLINIETTLKAGAFPIKYSPVEYNYFGIESTVSGVGYNVAKALNTLGAKPNLYSIIGQDIYKDIIISELTKQSIGTSYIVPSLEKTPQSVILYDSEGNRKIYLDLKDIQETSYEINKNKNIFKGTDLAVICNINFARRFLKEAVKAGVPVATDVHVTDSVDDEYNKEFMQYADILFMSNEKILGKEESFIKEVETAFGNSIIVIGMGSKGSLIYVKADNKTTFFSSYHPRKVISTIGAGDALFSSFIYFYKETNDPYLSIQYANFFASYKIGEKGAANGFLNPQEVVKLFKSITL